VRRSGPLGLITFRRGTVPHDHFDRLLVVLLVEFVIGGVTDSPATRFIAAALYIFAVLLAVRTTGARTLRWAPRVIALGAVGMVGVGLAPSSGSTAQGWAAICTATVALGALLAVLGRIVRHKVVGMQTIAGALCAYLLIGFFFGSIYTAADMLGTAPLFGKAVDVHVYSYFSFVTLTTTGYGDFTPVTYLGQRLAVMEAMAGQIFLATMVARLVALLRTARRAEEAEAKEP
jgi:hypothetical protein